MYKNISFQFRCLLPHLKLQLHASHVLSALHLGQLLHVGVQTPGSHFSVPARHGLQQGLVDEAVLVLRLHHVVPLRAHQGHMTVDVHSALVSDALQHGVDDDETARATNTSTGTGGGHTCFLIFSLIGWEMFFIIRSDRM